MAKKRLNNLHTLQKKDPELINKYNNQLLKQHKHGFIELVHDPTIHRGVLRHIPHFPVLKDSSTTAMRIAYDASARISKKPLCLSDYLYTGLKMMQPLETMLVNFRQHKVAFTADIEKAFLQIELNLEDSDATRFLWLEDVIISTYDLDNLITYRFCRVLFGAAPSPYLLNATIQHYLAKQNHWVSKDPKKSTYIYYFERAGMNLRQ